MAMRLIVLAGALLVIGGCQTLAGSTDPELNAVMSGGQEVPGPGDLDGSGSFTATIKAGTSELCYSLEVGGIEPATAAHIHRGAAGEAGPPVLTIEPPTHSESIGCADVGRDLAVEMTAAPARFYVNVHNPDFPAGAVRGQLSRR